ncbi:hypothetical protein CNY89_10525 [Amaricoccus sp. HAR-UPW-R2A-40]|nr:hypothetical protein CNY89_10525 [Amaricoccus sp. HAR-UPW-R2A-40]
MFMPPLMTDWYMPGKHDYAGLSLENAERVWDAVPMAKGDKKPKHVSALAHWRKARGLSQGQLGEKAGIDQPSVSRFELGTRRPSIGQTMALAEALGIDPRELLPSRSTDQATGRALSGAVTPAAPNVLQRLAESIASVASRPGFDLWQVRDRSMQTAGYLPGDFMLVRELGDEGADILHVGDAVIAQVLSPVSGEAETVFRRFDPPFLMPSSLDPEDKPVLGIDAQIRGKVVASWRLPEMAA